MVADSIIKRRLTSLRERQAAATSKAAQAREDLARRAASNGVTVKVQSRIDAPNDFALTCRPMPLAFYYGQDSVPGRDAEFTRRRATFYTLCARVFGFEGWRFDQYSHEIFLASAIGEGREGRSMHMMPIDQTQAVNINANAAPLEWLVSQNWLETKADPPGFAMLRFATALHFRDIVLGSQSGGLKAQAYEGGGGGFGPRLVSDYALDCMASVSAVRQKLQPGLFHLLQQVVVDDQWVWEPAVERVLSRLPTKVPATPKARRRYEKMRRALIKKRRDPILRRLHKAIDAAAVVLEYMSEGEYASRWIRRR